MPTGDPNHPHFSNNVDYDISYINNVYAPVAMEAKKTGNGVGYVGTLENTNQFQAKFGHLRTDPFSTAILAVKAGRTDFVQPQKPRGKRLLEQAGRVRTSFRITQPQAVTISCTRCCHLPRGPLHRAGCSNPRTVTTRKLIWPITGSAG